MSLATFAASRRTASLLYLLYYFSFCFWFSTYCDALFVRTPATKSYVQQYLSKNYNGNVVAAGGWHTVEQDAVSELAARNFALWRPYLPSWFQVVPAGGWATVQSLAADPKGRLIQLIQEQLVADGAGKETSDMEWTTLLALLHAQGRGFDSQLVDGPWKLVVQRQGQHSPRVQKLVGRVESGRTLNSNSDFSVDKLQFFGTVKVLRGLGKLSSTVQYLPVAQAFESRKVDKSTSIILRRIACDITKATWKFWKLPTVPLPFLKRKGGYLDFVYLDHDLRITRGNRGGWFVHARPDFVETILLSASSSSI